ncbi:MAG: DNA primase, partial [Armatimonadetes bacterium]|nr:DNA primase [Armatimonadota bacterium]
MRLGGEALKEEIRRRVDLVDLAASYVTLRKSGRYYKGLCPFHQEKTPSFHVDRERGLFHCFGCGAGGDLFDFVMRVQRLTFPEALEELARRAGVEVERSPEAARRATEQERLYQAMDAAVRFFEEQVRVSGGVRARAYLERRGVDAEMARRFRLGYAPEGWDGLLRALEGRGFAAGLLERCGLVAARQSGSGHYDMFRHRLVFPILDLRDRPVALGARALDDAVPKYLNSPETPLFSKSRMLYALNWAREAVRAAGEIVVVEGYMDALTCHQLGVAHAVASLGTALTMDQVLLCKRFAPRVILVYDSDAAGMAATERAMELFEDAEVEVRIAVLPGGGDPDRYLRDHGAEAFRALLGAAMPIFDYRLDRATARHDARTTEGKVAIADEVLP